MYAVCCVLESLRLLLAAENLMLKLRLTGREGFFSPYTAYSLLLSMSQHWLGTARVEQRKYLTATSLFCNPEFYFFFNWMLFLCPVLLKKLCFRNKLFHEYSWKNQLISQPQPKVLLSIHKYCRIYLKMLTSFGRSWTGIILHCLKTLLLIPLSQ